MVWNQPGFSSNLPDPDVSLFNFDGDIICSVLTGADRRFLQIPIFAQQ